MRPHRWARTLVFASAGVWIAIQGVSWGMGPNLVFTPGKGEAGGNFEIAGSGFAPEEQVFINWDHPAANLAQTVAGAEGDIKLVVVIPADSPEGLHKVTLAGDKGSSAVHTFQVGDVGAGEVPPAKATDIGSFSTLSVVIASGTALVIGVLAGWAFRKPKT